MGEIASNRFVLNLVISSIVTAAGQISLTLQYRNLD